MKVKVEFTFSGPDPQGMGRSAIDRLKRLLKLAGRMGARAAWWTDGGANGVQLPETQPERNRRSP